MFCRTLYYVLKYSLLLNDSFTLVVQTQSWIILSVIGRKSARTLFPNCRTPIGQSGQIKPPDVITNVQIMGTKPISSLHSLRLIYFTDWSPPLRR
jgi:hypothetical protein